MRLAGIDVEVQRAVRSENAPRLLEARAQPIQVIVEAVVEGVSRLLLGPIPPAGEADAPAGGVSVDARACRRAPFPRVEGRIDIHKACAAVGQAAEHFERFSANDRRSGRGDRGKAGVRHRPVQ